MAGREGPPLTFRAMKGVLAGRGDPHLHFKRQRGWWQAEETPTRISSDRGGGGRQRGPLLAFQATEGMVEGVAGREGPPLAFQAMEGVVAGRGSPLLEFQAMEGVAGREGPPLAF